MPVSVRVLFLSLVSEGLVNISSSAGLASLLSPYLKINYDGFLPPADIDLLQQFPMHLRQFFLQELDFLVAVAVVAGLVGVGFVGVIHRQLIL